VKQPIRVVLADGYPILLKGLEALLSAERDFEVVARCQDGEETLRAVRAHRPDLLVLDLRMPGKDGLQVLRELRGESNPLRVVLLVTAIDEEQLLEVTRLGVRGVVLKEMALPLLVRCLRKVHAGDVWIEHASMARAFTKLFRREAGAREISDLLTPRGLQIALMAARGMRSKAIGEALHISEGTVKTHLHIIYERLGRGEPTAARRVFPRQGNTVRQASNVSATAMSRMASSSAGAPSAAPDVVVHPQPTRQAHGEPRRDARHPPPGPTRTRVAPATHSLIYWCAWQGSNLRPSA